MANGQRVEDMNVQCEGVAVWEEGMTENRLDEVETLFRKFVRDCCKFCFKVVSCNEGVVAGEDLPVSVDEL